MGKVGKIEPIKQNQNPMGKIVPTIPCRQSQTLRGKSFPFARRNRLEFAISILMATLLYNPSLTKMVAEEKLVCS